MESMELANYLEKVRYGRKISQEKFVEGICSLRQYQRYRSGECEIPIEKLESFNRRLGIPSQKLLKDFERQKKEQDALLDEFYNAMVNQKTEQINEINKIIRQDIIIEEENKTYYNYIWIMNKLMKNELSESQAFAKVSKLINFPKILKNQYFTDIEILILSSLLELTDGDIHKKLLHRLSDLFTSEENIMSGGSDLIHSTILMSLSKTYGILRDFTKVIQFCDLGLKRGLHSRRFYLFESFYYYKALAYHALEDYSNYEDNLFKCYNVLHMEGNQQKTERFTDRIEKDFKIKFDLFIINYLKKAFV